MEQAIVVATGAALVGGFLGLLVYMGVKGKPHFDKDSGTLVFRHGRLFRGFAFCFAFVVPVGFKLLFVFEDGEPLLANNGAEVGIFACGFLLYWEAIRFRLVLSREGMECRSPWRGTRTIGWADLRELVYDEMHSWFVLKTVDGWSFRIYIFVPGINEFLEACESRLPPTAFKAAENGYKKVGRALPKERQIL